MVFLLGGFTMVGLTPGPSMLTDHLDLSLALLFAVLVANVVAFIVCFPIAQYLAKIGLVPARILVPLIIVMALIGAFAVREEFIDVVLTFAFGVLGLAMRRWNYNPVALLLGYVLGVLFERSLFVALSLSGPWFFLRPISLTLIFITITVLVYGPIKSALARRRGIITP
jgi:putative tricarboxylic transport membrane protein